MTLKGPNYICLSEDFLGQLWNSHTERFHAYIRSKKQFVVEYYTYSRKSSSSDSWNVTYVHFLA